MSAVWVKICAVLSLCYSAEMKEVVWREVGESVTIQCRCTTKRDFSLHFKRGLWEDMDIAKIINEFKLTRLEKQQMKISERKLYEIENMIDRVEFNGTFPNIDFLLKNLSVDDTGAYWCLYSSYEGMMKGDGSVIVVVKDREVLGNENLSHARAEAMQGSDEPTVNMPWVYAVPAAVLFLGIISSFIIWIKRRTKSSDITVEETRVYAVTASADVDEEQVEAEAEDETVRVLLANPTESLNTLDHSVKSDEC